MYLEEETPVRPAAGQLYPYTPHGLPHAGTYLEELQPQRIDLGSRKLGTLEGEFPEELHQIIGQPMQDQPEGVAV